MVAKRFLLALCTLASSALSAQSSGVLLGLQTANGSDDSLHTVLITRENGVVRLAADGPDLILPHKSGFSRLCIVSGRTVSEGQLDEWDSLVIERATPQRGPCRTAAAAQSEEEARTSRCQSSSRIILQFAGSRAVSLEEHSESDCGAHYSGGTELTLRSLDKDREINVSKLLRPAEYQALTNATLKSAREEFADLGTVDTASVESEDNDYGAHFDLHDQWGIERAAGTWKMRGQASCWPYVACGDGGRTFSIALASSPALVGNNSLSPSLAVIRARYPEVSDAVSSPRGDLVVAVTSDSLMVFAVDNGRLGSPAIRVPMSGRIVMAEWALGRLVPLWSAQLPAILRAR